MLQNVAFPCCWFPYTVGSVFRDTVVYLVIPRNVREVGRRLKKNRVLICCKNDVKWIISRGSANAPLLIDSRPNVRQRSESGSFKTAARRAMF